MKDKPFTTRSILLSIRSNYNLLCLVSTILITGKKILQELIKDSKDCDDFIPDVIKFRWEKWQMELLLQKLTIPRCYMSKDFSTQKSAEMHHFSDASQYDYDQCSYLRLIENAP
uniref:Uncharacterized protein LOC102806621 n=1 Tax=Saccoglossus kowalevskii TaxID=10224 RepID=A0ABM0N1D1_SACKO|nr:PREDICTED: uncharacterized protein LOC102806621 [Saccoglossus kowalevskii]